LRNNKEWRLYGKGKLKGKRKKPDDIPANPNQTYKDKGWVSTGDWLGTRTVATHLRNYRDFKKARRFVHNVRLKSGNEWKLYCKGGLKGKRKKPDDIPAYPNQTYKDKGWKGMGDWLGK
jgi:hypothetical protein